MPELAMRMLPSRTHLRCERCAGARLRDASGGAARPLACEGPPTCARFPAAGGECRSGSAHPLGGARREACARWGHGTRLRRDVRADVSLLANDVQRAMLDLVEDTAHVLADHAECDQLYAAQQQHGDRDGSEARQVGVEEAQDDDDGDRHEGRSSSRPTPASSPLAWPSWRSPKATPAERMPA